MMRRSENPSVWVRCAPVSRISEASRGGGVLGRGSSLNGIWCPHIPGEGVATGSGDSPGSSCAARRAPSARFVRMRSPDRKGYADEGGFRAITMSMAFRCGMPLAVETNSLCPESRISQSQ